MLYIAKRSQRWRAALFTSAHPGCSDQTKMPKPILAWVPMLWWLLPAGAWACDDLMAQIDAKIRASGAVNFTLVTADMDAPTTGRVVGTCGLGKKKIVYTPTGPFAGASAPAGAPGAPGATAGPVVRAQRTFGTMGAPVVGNPVAARPAAPGVLTECKEGYTGSDCRQRKPPPEATPVEPRKP